jgi:large subunit ribosomal protein L19e
MKLDKKKDLAVRTLKVGKGRIVFNANRMDDIKEAITKQDIKDLVQDNAITIKQIKGSKKKAIRKTRRRSGSVRKKVNTRKQDYVKQTRKLRSYLSTLKKQNIITPELFTELRKEIRARTFRSLSQMKDKIKEEKK